jgi:hypothetical protein
MRERACLIIDWLRPDARNWLCFLAQYHPGLLGGFLCARRCCIMQPGWSTAPRTCGGTGVIRPGISPPISGGSPCSPWAKGGTTITMPFRARPGTAYGGGKSMSLTCSSACWAGWVSPSRSMSRARSCIEKVSQQHLKSRRVSHGSRSLGKGAPMGDLGLGNKCATDAVAQPDQWRLLTTTAYGSDLSYAH